MQIDANKLDTIARGPFAPVYPLLASQILARSSITSGVCLDLGSGGGYRKKKVWGFDELSVSLNLMNLFDKKYISTIKNNQDVSEALSTSYYPGAPFTVVGTVGVKF